MVDNSIQTDQIIQDIPVQNNQATGDLAQQPKLTLQQIPSEIRIFLEDMLTQANIPVLDEESKNVAILDLYDRLDRFLSAKIAESLSEEDTEAFIKLNDEGKSQEEIDAFLQAHIPDVQGMFSSAFAEFRDYYFKAQENYQEESASENSQQ